MNMAVAKLDLVSTTIKFGKRKAMVPADHFFANFNLDVKKNDCSAFAVNGLDVVSTMSLQVGCNKVVPADRSKNGMPFLMKGRKPGLSLGLFAPDTITSLGKTGEDYHKNNILCYEVIKEISQFKNQRTRTGTGLPTS